MECKMQLMLLALVFPFTAWSLPHDISKDVLKHRRSGPHSFDLARINGGRSGSEAISPNSLNDTEQRQKYLLPVMVEDQTFNLELDTGSADMWIIQSDFSCYKYGPPSYSVTFSGPQDQDKCNFGATYTPGTGFQEDPTLYIYESYGDGNRAILGPMGEVTVTIGDISVKQLIGAPNTSSFPAYGTHVQSGVMGLGPASLTSAFNATPPTLDTLNPYSPIMETIFNDLVATPQFSLALSRDDSMNGVGGIFTIGGLPDNSSAVNISASDPTTAKLQIYADFDPTQQNYYSIFIDDYAVGDQSLNADLQVIIDSGDAYFRVPKATRDAMNALWSPAPEDGDAEDALDCSAVLTSDIGVTIGGTTYYMESRDLLGIDENGICYSLITRGDDDTFNVLGDPFLKNVLAVFDWTSNNMEFYPRRYYES